MGKNAKSIKMLKQYDPQAAWEELKSKPPYSLKARAADMYRRRHLGVSTREEALIMAGFFLGFESGARFRESFK